jgi:hypothetical protein
MKVKGNCFPGHKKSAGYIKEGETSSVMIAECEDYLVIEDEECYSA